MTQSWQPVVSGTFLMMFSGKYSSCRKKFGPTHGPASGPVRKVGLHFAQGFQKLDGRRDKDGQRTIQQIQVRQPSPWFRRQEQVGNQPCPAMSCRKRTFSRSHIYCALEPIGTLELTVNFIWQDVNRPCLSPIAWKIEEKAQSAYSFTRANHDLGLGCVTHILIWFVSECGRSRKSKDFDAFRK